MSDDLRHLSREDSSRITRLVNIVVSDARLDQLNDKTIDAVVLAVDVMLESHLEATDAKIAVLSRERSSFLADRDTFAAERDKLKRENETLKRERDLADKMRFAAVEAHDKLRLDTMREGLQTAGEIAKISIIVGRKTMVGSYVETLADAAVRMSNAHFEAAAVLRDQLLDLSGALGYGRTDPPEFESLLVDVKNLRAKLTGKNSTGEQLKAASDALKVANDRIAQLETGFGEVCKHLGMGVPEDASDKADAIINLLKLNYIHMDTLAGGERLFDCRICNKRSRWNHEHQTLGYVQRLCSDCFQEHGVAPTDKSLGDGSYAKAVRMGSPLRSPNAQNELDAVKSALGECWMEGDGRTVAGTVKSVCEALDRSNEQRSELEKALADFIFGTQDALGDFWGKGRIGSSSAEIIRGVCAKAREAELMFEERRQLAEYRAAFDRILVALGIKTDYPTIAGKAQACVSIIEAFISGYKLMDETNKARRELFEKAAKVFEKLAEEWKIAGSAQLANTLGSAERS